MIVDSDTGCDDYIKKDTSLNSSQLAESNNRTKLYYGTPEIEMDKVNPTSLSPISSLHHSTSMNLVSLCKRGSPPEPTPQFPMKHESVSLYLRNDDDFNSAGGDICFSQFGKVAGMESRGEGDVDK